jgi:hypothetical protein
MYIHESATLRSFSLHRFAVDTFPLLCYAPPSTEASLSLTYTSPTTLRPLARQLPRPPCRQVVAVYAHSCLSNYASP